MQGVKGAKMNWKNRLTNYNFWISIVSAVLLILQAFEFQFDIVYINEIATAVLGLLVVIGIINDPTKTTVKKEKTITEQKKEETEKIKIEKIEEVEIPVEETTVLDNVKADNIESAEEQTFPIDEENEIVDDIDENDIKNLVDAVSDDESNENNKIKEMFENLLILLKNSEKTCKKTENLENFSKNEEISSEIKLTETEIKPEEIFEESKEIVAEDIDEIKNEEEIEEFPNSENVIEQEK